MDSKVSYLDLTYGLMNEKTKEYEEDMSSSVKTLPLLFNESNYENIPCFLKPDTSMEIHDRNSFSELDRLIIRRNLIDDEAEKDRIVKKLVQDLEKALELFDEENEEYSSVERKIVDIEYNYNMIILGEAIQDIYVHHFYNPSYLLGICRSLLRYDLDEVRPWGATMLSGLLSHPDERVKEYAVQLIDNWSDVELLPILKKLQVSTDWLRNYIKDVVKSLEKEDIPYKKIV